MKTIKLHYVRIRQKNELTYKICLFKWILIFKCINESTKLAINN
jgi:hypothetical protein